MAKTSAWGKAQRVLRFLLGLSNPRIAAAMVVHGFSEADLDEGWRLLRAGRPVRLDALPPPVPEHRPLEPLLEWEREWVPIARAALRQEARRCRPHPRPPARARVLATPACDPAPA